MKNASAKQLMKLQANPNDVDVALEVFATIQSATGLGLSVDVATTLLTTFKKQKLSRALQVLELCKKQKVSLRVPPYEDLMTSCYRTKEFDLALKIFDLLRRCKLTPSNLMYTTALLSAHKAGQSELVLKTLDQMLENAKPYTSRAFEVALSAAVNSRQHELVLALVEHSKTLDVVMTSEHYHFILKSYATVGDMQAALDTRDTLQHNGFDLTEDKMYWLVHCAAKADRWNLVQEFLSSPSSSADNREGIVITANAFKSAIAVFGNKDHWNKVVDVYDIMPETSVKNYKTGIWVLSSWGIPRLTTRN